MLQHIYLSAQINYRFNLGNLDYQVYQLSYKDDKENIFNISYNNIANNWSALTKQQIDQGKTPLPQENITVSSIINLNMHWGIAVLWDYNIEQKKIANTFIGIQYNAKSWNVRALWQSTAYTNEDPNKPQILGSLTSTYILELELKGIGGIGNTTNLASRLNQINGYNEKQWGV
jgi:LPS-assembly protein